MRRRFPLIALPALACVIFTPLAHAQSAPPAPPATASPPTAAFQETPPPAAPPESASTQAADPEPAAPAAAPTSRLATPQPYTWGPESSFDPTLIGQESSRVDSAKPDDAAAPPAQFGSEGQMVITTDLHMSFGYTGDTETDDSELRLRLTPSVDRFLTRNLSVGVVAVLDYSDQTYDAGIGKINAKTTSGGLGFGFGYNVSIGTLLSWWPRVRAGVSVAGTKVNRTAATSAVDPNSPPSEYTIHENWLWTDLFLPLLFHPVPHFFIGIGPYGSYEPDHEVGSAHHHRFTVSVATEVGGWF